MIKDIKEQELLDLLGKSDPACIDYFRNNNILKINKTIICGCKAQYIYWESLADCSKRLWWQAMEYGTRRIDGAIYTIWLRVMGENLIGVGMPAYMDYAKMSKDWFLYNSPSKPIYTIDVALLALKRTGREVE